MRFVITFIFMISTICVSAQKVEDLRAQMKRYETEISQINKLLDSNNKQQATNVQNLKLVNQKIQNRKNIVVNLDKQIAELQKELGNEGNRVVELSDQLTQLKKTYSRLIKIAYLHYRQSTVQTFVSSEEKFMSLTKDVTYSSRISQGLKNRLQQVDTLHRAVKNQIDVLTEEQQKLVALLDSKASEVKKLEIDKKQLSTLTAQLNSKNSELNKKIDDNKKKLKELQNQIASFVTKESKTDPSRPINVGLSSIFEDNKGKLPSPVLGGVIIDRFGVRGQSGQADIVFNNNGVNIACSSGAQVRAIFEGEVRAIFPVKSMGNSIMIRHGKFLTVYSGLGNILVKKGDKISTGQILGNLDSAITILHFEIWNETTVLDPEQWVKI